MYLAAEVQQPVNVEARLHEVHEEGYVVQRGQVVAVTRATAAQHLHNLKQLYYIINKHLLVHIIYIYNISTTCNINIYIYIYIYIYTVTQHLHNLKHKELLLEINIICFI